MASTLTLEPRDVDAGRATLPAFQSPIIVQRFWMAASAVCAAILILAAYIGLDPRFTATAQIAFAAGERTIPVERLEAFVTSPTRIGRTVVRVGLATAAATDDAGSSRMQAIERVSAGLRVEQTDLTNVFVIRYTGSSRRLVAPIVNDLAGQIVAAGTKASLRPYVVQPATEPGGPDGSLLAPCTLALLGAALASVVTLGIREWRQEGPRSVASAEQMLSLPVIGAIPVVPRIAAGDRGALTALPVIAPRSDYAVALRRTLGPGLSIGRTIAICSALAGEGKTTFAISLARTAALEGRRVVLVDCDGRVRAASIALGLTQGAGLLQVMDGKTKLEHALAADPHSPLIMLGHSNDPAVRSFWSKDTMANLRRVTQDLAAAFDLVILDTPPLLALVEAREIAGLADQALLIARWRATPIPALQHAIKLLAGQHVRSALVLNFVRFAEPDRGDWR